jgi:hypothetical protein
MNIKNELEGLKLREDAETVETRKIVMSQNLVNLTSKILNLSNAVYLPEAYVYVSSRSRGSGLSTMLDVLKELQKKNVYFNQLLELPADQCQQAESSTK